MQQAFVEQGPSEKMHGEIDHASLSAEDRSQVIALIEQVRAVQEPDGAVHPDHAAAATIALQDAVQRLRPYCSRYPSLTQCLGDMEDWLATGLATKPHMRRLVEQGLTPIPEGGEDIMLTVTTTLNYSEHYALEFVHFRRFDGPPAAALRPILYCRYLTIAHLLEATQGFGLESNCIVCFTECLAGGGNATDVMDIFFTSKNALRGKVILQPLMERIFTPETFYELRGATLEDLRLIVPCKTVTHEWSHRQGVVPLTEFRVLFNNAIGAGLEEARVELNGALHLLTLSERGGPFAPIYLMAAQFIIADRILRYPYSAHPSENADAVSGQYFLGQFIAKRLLTCNAGGVSLAARRELIAGLTTIMADIEQAHYRALIASIPEAHRVMREHVATYSPALDDGQVMQRSLFYHWMIEKLRDVVPPAMNWKAAIDQHGG